MVQMYQAYGPNLNPPFPPSFELLWTHSMLIMIVGTVYILDLATCKKLNSWKNYFHWLLIAMLTVHNCEKDKMNNCNFYTSTIHFYLL